MLPEEIKQLIENTPRKERKISSPTELDAPLQPTLFFQFNITEPKEGSLLHNIRVDTPPIIRTFYDQHEKERLNLLKYVQTVGLVYAYHPLNIDLLAEAAVKLHLWKYEHNDKVEYLDPRNAYTKDLKRLFVDWLKELP